METFMIFTIDNEALDNDDNYFNMDNTLWQEDNSANITLKASKLLVGINTFLQDFTYI